MKTIFGMRSIGKLLRFCFLSVCVLFALGAIARPAQSLMAGEGLMWTVWSSAPVRLVVCWENPADAEPTQIEANQTAGSVRREWARLAVKGAWERAARVVFAGWGTCQNEGSPATPPHTLGPRRPGTADENLKVNISDEGASNNWGHGSWGDYQQSGVTINLHCGNQDLKDCIEYLAIHEFGHTLGFYHEEERVDWPTNIAGCPKQTWPPSDPWWPVPTELRFGSPDRYSVMAYCSGAPTSLTPKDVGAIQSYYKRRNPGTLLSVPGSLCLSAHAVDPNGDPAFGWECDEANNDQEWILDRFTNTLSITTTSLPIKERCLDVDTITGSKVQTWDCHDGANQQWSFRRVEVRGYGGLCLTRPNAGAGPVKMQPCGSSTEQLWRLTPGKLAGSFQIQSETSGLCLVASDQSGGLTRVEACNASYLPRVSNGGPAAGPGVEPAEIAEYPLAAGTKIKEFQLTLGGQIGVPVGGPTSYCLDVIDVWDADYRSGLGGPAAGQSVQTFQCYPAQLNQRWNLSGDVTSGGKCLTITGSRTANGAGTSVTRCDGDVDQDWDYYW